MSEKTKQLIMDAILLIPGINGIATMDLSKTPKSLPSDKRGEGVLIEDNYKKKDMSIAIITGDGINSNRISNEISSSIKNIANSNSFKLGKIKIYIRGIK